MAPSYVSSSATMAGSGNSVSVPAPASIAAGNLLVAIVYNGSNASSWTVPSGWTAGPTIGGTNSMAIFTKTATASEPASYGFTSGGGSYLGVAVLQYANAALDGTPQLKTGSSGVAASSTATGSSPDDLVVLAYGSYNGYTWSTPDGTTLRANGANSGNESLYVFDVAPGSATIPAYTSLQSTGGVYAVATIPLKGTDTGGGGSTYTVSAALSGTGGLTATSGVRTTQSAALAGLGTLSFGETMSEALSATATGSGALVATSRPALATSVAGTGTGGLSASTLTAETQSVPSSGSGSLTADVSMDGFATVGLSGTGGLTASTTMTATQSVAVSGSGSLTALAIQRSGSLATPSGAGTLDAVVSVHQTAAPATALSGVGTLTAGQNPVLGESAVDQAQGALTADSFASFVAEVALGDLNLLLVEGLPQLVSEVVLDATGELSGLAEITVVADLDGLGVLTATTQSFAVVHYSTLTASIVGTRSASAVLATRTLSASLEN